MLSLLLACEPNTNTETAPKNVADNCYIDKIGRNPDQFELETEQEESVDLINAVVGDDESPHYQIDASLHHPEDVDVYTIELFDDWQTDISLKVTLVPDVLEQWSLGGNLYGYGEPEYGVNPVLYELYLGRNINGKHEYLGKVLPRGKNTEITDKYQLFWTESNGTDPEQVDMYDDIDDSGLYEIRVAQAWSNNGTGVNCDHAYSLYVDVEGGQDNPPE